MKAGDIVICIDAGPNRALPEFTSWDQLKLHREYTVVRTGKLNEKLVVLHGVEGMFQVTRFVKREHPTLQHSYAHAVHVTG